MQSGVGIATKASVMKLAGKLAGRCPSTALHPKVQLLPTQDLLQLRFQSTPIMLSLNALDYLKLYQDCAQDSVQTSLTSMNCVRRLLQSTQVPVLYAQECETSAHLVFPFKLSPHASELHIGTAGWANVIHDVDVDIVQHHHAAVCIG